MMVGVCSCKEKVGRGKKGGLNFPKKSNKPKNAYFALRHYQSQVLSKKVLSPLRYVGTPYGVGTYKRKIPIIMLFGLPQIYLPDRYFFITSVF